MVHLTRKLVVGASNVTPGGVRTGGLSALPPIDDFRIVPMGKLRFEDIVIEINLSIRFIHSGRLFDYSFPCSMPRLTSHLIAYLIAHILTNTFVQLDNAHGFGAPIKDFELSLYKTHTHALTTPSASSTVASKRREGMH